MQHALACSCDVLSVPCGHEHTNECVECNMAPILFLQLKAWASARAQQSLLKIHSEADGWERWHKQHDSSVHSSADCGSPCPAGVMFGSKDYKHWVNTGFDSSWREAYSPGGATETAIEKVVALEEGMSAHIFKCWRLKSRGIKVISCANTRLQLGKWICFRM